MKSLITELQRHINDLISIHFYRKVEGIVQKTSDASYSVYLKSVELISGLVNIKFTNGMDKAGKSDFTVTVPENAQVNRENDGAWKIEYTSDEDVLIIKMFLPELSRKSSVATPDSKQGIKEVRNVQNELEKLIIETPDTGVTIEFLSLVKKILEQVLVSWKHFTVTSSESTQEEALATYDFLSLESVNLPGNTFFEINAIGPLGNVNFEVATSLTINTKETFITFRLEDITYKIKKA